MSEQQPTFTVTDRRKFTLDGDLREDPGAPEEHAVTNPIPEPEPDRVPDNVVTMPAPVAAAEAAPEEADSGDDGERPQFTAQESAEAHSAYQQSSRQIDEMIRQANPGMAAAGEIGFEHVIQSFYVSAMMALGAGTEPGQKPRIDILGARQSIDMLALLQQKTKGNLTPKEEAMLQNVLFELRMMFLEITNAIAAQAQRPVDGKIR
ncbi:MAG: DUF1844 domain-containing protein [Acidobacteriaceae bacterium]